MYIKRHVEDVVKKATKMFSAVLITGPRQVGKTTLLKNLLGNLEYVSFDDPVMLMMAKEEPGNFFQKHLTPLIIDEVQYAPELFPYVKMIADRSNKTGLFYLTGSQSFHLMKNVTETMAGRVGIISLQGFSLREIYRVSYNKPFIPIENYFSERNKYVVDISYSEIFKRIHKGHMPALENDEQDIGLFYESYLNTYIQRDVRDLMQVGNLSDFVKFMTVAAARTGQMLNYNDIARDVGVSAPTIKSWLSVLEASGIVYLLQPYFNNVTKRAIKTPKLYFLNTGLAAHLTRWSTPETLERGAMAGAFFETFVISEILKSYLNAGITNAPLYYYRDKDKREIDLIIEADGKLHPIEIKKTANPSSKDISNFAVLDNLGDVKRGSGGIICTYKEKIKISLNDYIIPISYI
ncbi:MAG: ATP-binding protein [Christensenellales bacterium]|jgi:predicted AAA+ superfamily ATPase|nr:ATP-binding protein [Clostridiales bacterium]